MPATVPQPTMARAAASAAADPAQDAGTRQGTALLAALLAACVYAAFADGATAAPEETRLQVAIAALALAAVVALTGARDALRLRAGRAALAGAGCLAAFALWTAVTLAWSVAPDATWTEFNRALAYALVAALALCAGASAPRAVERLALGYLGLAVVVCLYAFGGKAIPGVHVWFVDFDHTDQISRLRAPLGYWNALALVLVLAVPIALRIAVHRDGSDRRRLAALGTVSLLIATTAMTYSRGGILALVTATAITVWLGADRLRSLLALALATLAAIPVIAIDFGRDSLTENGAPLRERIADGRSITAMAIVMGAMLVATGWYLLRVEHAGSWSAARSRTLGRGLALLAAFYLLASVGGAAQQPGGLGEQISKSWHAFTDIRQDRQYDPVRLASTNSGNRWVWWQEAIGSWSDRPLGGWGAGSFPVVHLQYRENTIPVAQPHSVPLQFLSETGLVGLLLAGGGLGLLGAAALRRVRATPRGRDRELGIALLAGGAAWVVHGAYDWDWDIPGVTLPVLVFLGVLAARPPGTADPLRGGAALFADPDREERGALARAAVVGAATLLACAVVASALLPWMSTSRTQDAQAKASADRPTPAQLHDAAAEADVAARLDPLSPEPLFAAYAIALQRGRLVEARQKLLEAADRAPNDPRVWTRLAALAFQLADRPGYQQASLRALSLDPRNPGLRRAAARAVAFVAPPNASATATGTPLPAAPAG